MQAKKNKKNKKCYWFLLLQVLDQKYNFQLWNILYFLNGTTICMNILSNVDYLLLHFLTVLLLKLIFFYNLLT